MYKSPIPTVFHLFFFFRKWQASNLLLKYLLLFLFIGCWWSSINPSCFSTDLHFSDDPITGMLDTESPVMESNGDAFLPDLPVLGQTADWSPGQVTPDPLANILPEDSDASQDAPLQQQSPNEEMDSSELGSVERAVEHFQIATAQLFQVEQPPPPPLPAEEEERPEQPEPPAEHKTESGEYEQYGLEMTVMPEALVHYGSQGN